jgi:hypothetical protein
MLTHTQMGGIDARVPAQIAIDVTDPMPLAFWYDTGVYIAVQVGSEVDRVASGEVRVLLGETNSQLRPAITASEGGCQRDNEDQKASSKALISRNHFLPPRMSP